MTKTQTWDAWKTDSAVHVRAPSGHQYVYTYMSIFKDKTHVTVPVEENGVTRLATVKLRWL